MFEFIKKIFAGSKIVKADEDIRFNSILTNLFWGADIEYLAPGTFNINNLPNHNFYIGYLHETYYQVYKHDCNLHFGCENKQSYISITPKK